MMSHTFPAVLDIVLRMYSKCFNTFKYIECPNERVVDRGYTRLTLVNRG